MDFSELQMQLFTDPEIRKAFCENPKEFLASHGIETPENVALPESISVEDMDNHISSLEERLNKRGLSFNRQMFKDIRTKPQFRSDLFKGINIKPDLGHHTNPGNIMDPDGAIEDIRDRVGTNQTAAFVVAAVVYISTATWSYSTL